MKNEKGVTLITISVYCVIMIAIIGIIGVIRNNAEDNMREITALKGAVPEINRLSMFMVDETKDSTNGIKKISSDGKMIEFKNGHVYIWTDDEIYKVTDNKRIRVCKEVADCTFGYDVQNSKEILKVTLQLKGKNYTFKTMEYVFV